MIELPVLIENIIEIVNVAIEMMLVFLYFSLLSKAKVNKAVLYLSYLLSTVILSATVLLTDNILVYLITTIILISSMSFICYDDSIRHKIFWNILFLLIISISEPIVIGLLCIANMGTPDEFLESGLGRYLGMVGTNIIYLWLIGLMHRIINKKIRELPIKYWILIIVIPIISIFLLQTMLDGFVGSNTYSYVSLGVSLAGIIFINLAMFYFFESFEDKIKLKYLETDLALIAVVGRAMKSNRGTAGRIFSALAHAHVNVKMIDQGSSELNIIIGVNEADFESAMKAIYTIFVDTQL